MNPITAPSFRAAVRGVDLDADSGRTPVDSETIGVIEELVRTDPVIHMCMKDLLDEVFSTSLEFYRGGKPVEPSVQLTYVVERYFKPCCLENLQSVYEKGVGLMSLVPCADVKGGLMVRYPRCAVQIETYYDTEADRQVFVAYRDGALGPMHQVLGQQGPRAGKKKAAPGKSGRANDGRAGGRARERSRVKKEGGGGGDADRPTGGSEGALLSSEEDGSGEGERGASRGEIHVLSGYGHDPDAEGRLRSPLSAIVAESSFMVGVERAYMECLAKNSDIRVYTEVPDEKSSLDERFGIGLYADAGSSSGVEAYQYKRTTEHADTLKAQYRAYGDSFRSGYGDRGIRGVGLTKAAAVRCGVRGPGGSNGYEDLRPLPPGHKYVRRDLNAPPDAFLQLKENYQDTCAALFGTARATILGGNSRTTAGITVASEYRTRTLAGLRRIAGRMLTRFYQVTHWQEEFDAICAPRSGEMAGRELSDSDLRSAARERCLTIVVPSREAVPMDGLLGLYSADAISRQEFVNEARKAFGLPPVDPEDPLFARSWPDHLKESVLRAENRADLSGAMIRSTDEVVGMNEAALAKDERKSSDHKRSRGGDDKEERKREKKHRKEKKREKAHKKRKEG